MLIFLVLNCFFSYFLLPCFLSLLFVLLNNFYIVLVGLFGVVVASISQKVSSFTFLLPIDKLFECLGRNKLVFLQSLEQSFVLSFKTFLCLLELLLTEILTLALSRIFIQSDNCQFARFAKL